MSIHAQPPTQAFAERVIGELGGTSEVARLCKVEPAAVSQWKKNGIPGYREDFLRLARPDVFEKLKHDGDDSEKTLALSRTNPC